jgi:hypothetical protein
MALGFLSVAGIDLEITACTPLPRVRRGEAVRAFDLTLLDGRDLGKGEWRATLYPMAPAAAAVLRGLIYAGPVAVAGSAVGAEVLCVVEEEPGPYGPDVQSGREDYSSHNENVTLLIREV